jgi:protein-L-isoaspartate(D-aspartate) O-methyltransferase
MTTRQQMLDTQLRQRGIRDSRVLCAMEKVPREPFIPESSRSQPYEDHPLSIGYDQTISQPYVVALMLEFLELKPVDKVLEIGSGSGYVTALLAEICEQVFSVERIGALADQSRQTLSALGYSNVTVTNGDGTLGLPVHAPYDVILVSAGALQIPAALLSQLCDGGRMVIPVGPPDSQQLQLIRMIDGYAEISHRDPVRFVPLVSDQP